jgi:hypothetical protein
MDKREILGEYEKEVSKLHSLLDNREPMMIQWWHFFYESLDNLDKLKDKLLYSEMKIPNTDKITLPVQFTPE